MRNGNGFRQKNGPFNEPPQPNAWRILEKNPIQRNENIERRPILRNEKIERGPILRNENVERKPNQQKTVNAVVSNTVNTVINSHQIPTTSQVQNEVGELVNLAHKVNVAERLKKQKESEANVATEADILKRMLGVGQMLKAPNPSAVYLPSVQPPNNTQQLDLNSLFGKAAINDQGSILPNPASLPKPPTAWQQKTKDKERIFLPHPLPQQQQQQPPQPQPSSHPQPHQQPQPPQQQPPFFPNNHPMMGPSLQYHPQYFPQQHQNMPPMNMMPYQQQMMSPMYRHPMFIPNQNYQMQMMHHGAHMVPGPQPFMQAPHHIRMSGPPPHFDGGLQKDPSPIMHSSPEGPQKLKTMSGTASAFIPLQAARKNTKTLKSNLVRKVASNDETNKDLNSDKPTEDDSKQVEVNPLKSNLVRKAAAKATDNDSNLDKQTENSKQAEVFHHF